MIDLSMLGMEDLRRIQVELVQEIENRRAQERTLVLEELAALARARGFKLEDLWRTMKPANKAASVSRASRAAGKRARVKFRHPEKTDLMWSGLGRKPYWVIAWLAEGGIMNELAV